MKKQFSALILAASLLVGSTLPFLSACGSEKETDTGNTEENETLIPDEDDKLFENCVFYKDFGAVGDGVTDDFSAIKEAHKYANEHQVPVKADAGASYFIAPHEATITVRTSTDWGNACFTVDDKSAEQDSQEWWYPLFDVRPDKEGFDRVLPTDYSLKAGQKNVNLTFDEPALLRLINENKKDFIRYGNNENDGDSRQEIVLVDENGNVDKDTPIQWDYTEVTKMTVYSVNESPILLRGGTFTTIANDDTRVMHYFNRAIDIKRSNTRVKNVRHYVTGEGDMGSPYNGFFRTNYANNVTFESCVMTGHRTYENERGVSQGTYDTRLNCSNNIRYLNCTQSNSITDNTYWGIMCSDYCKNLLMDGCTLSRFDAHMGVYNATVRNSEIGQNISITGGGLFLLENSVRISAPGTTGQNRFITLRHDYGSLWNGDIVLRNCTLKSGSGLNYILDAYWFNWKFDYVCHLPKTVTIDNVKIEYLSEVNYKHQYIFSQITGEATQTPAYAAASNNPPVITERIIIRNEQTVFAKTLNKYGWFEETEMIRE